MAGFQFPPPASESGDGWEDVDYPTADRGGRFILPPPRRTPGGDVDEVAQRISDEISWIRDTARDAGLGVEGLEQEVHNLGTVVTDYGDALDEKVGPDAVPTIMPLSQTINRRADPVFGLSDFMTPGGWTGTPGGGDTHRHPLGTAGGAEWSAAVGANSKGRVYMAFITPAINRVYERINFLVGPVTNPCRMDVAVYLLDADTKLWRRQALKVDVPAPIAESVATVELDEPWIATQGSYVAIAWLQHGSGNVRDLLGLNDTPRPLPDFVYPHKISAIHTSTGMTGLPATINGETQTDFDFWFTPYAELSENVGIVLRTFTESWPDIGGDIGRPWVALTSRGIGSRGGYTSAGGSGLRVSIYDTPLSTDYVRVRSSIYRDHSSGTIRRSTLIVRSTNDMRSGVGLSALSRTRYELIQWSNLAVDSDEDWDDRTVVATIDRAPIVGETIEIDYLDGYVTVRLDGYAHLTDVPVSGPQGAAGRFVGIQNRRQSLITASYSPWFGPWSARDLPQANGDDETGDGGDGDDGGED